ncbi:MAG: hypothetical protein ACO1QB_04420 [Verrucomicrobiales bacterium]
MKKLAFPSLALALSISLAPASLWAQDAKKPEQASQAEKKQEKLPSARSIIDRSIEKMGGKENFKKHTSQHAKGKFSIPAQEVNGNIEIFASAPNKLLMKIVLPGIGNINTGYNGKIGWQLNPITGPMLLEGKTLEQVASQADFYSMLHESSKYTTMETVGKETFEGKECYKVKLIEKSGLETMEFYSQETGLLVGSISKQESPFGAATVVSTIDDYKNVGDFLLPSKVTQKLSGLSQVITMDEVEFDKVEQSVFEVPKEIQTLAEQKK